VTDDLVTGAVYDILLALTASSGAMANRGRFHCWRAAILADTDLLGLAPALLLFSILSFTKVCYLVGNTSVPVPTNQQIPHGQGASHGPIEACRRILAIPSHDAAPAGGTIGTDPTPMLSQANPAAIPHIYTGQGGRGLLMM
jgi:hypothetical protein